MLNTEVGVRIRKKREAQHRTREEVAETVGISTKFLYEIELGRKGFSAETLAGLSQALSVSCDYLMFGEELKLGISDAV